MKICAITFKSVKANSLLCSAVTWSSSTVDVCNLPAEFHFKYNVAKQLANKFFYIYYRFKHFTQQLCSQIPLANENYITAMKQSVTFNINAKEI